MTTYPGIASALDAMPPDAALSRYRERGHEWHARWWADEEGKWRVVDGGSPLDVLRLVPGVVPIPGERDADLSHLVNSIETGGQLVHWPTDRRGAWAYMLWGSRGWDWAFGKTPEEAMYGHVGYYNTEEEGDNEPS